MPDSDAHSKRAFVLGLDGVPWPLIDEFVADGDLPNTLEGFIEAAERVTCRECGEDVHERYAEDAVCVGCQYGGGGRDV